MFPFPVWSFAAFQTYYSGAILRKKGRTLAYVWAHEDCQDLFPNHTCFGQCDMFKRECFLFPHFNQTILDPLSENNSSNTYIR